MTVLLALLAPAALVALYFLVIRPRGAHMLATYRAGGLGAVLSGFASWWAGMAGALALAVPELLTAFGGVDFKAMLPEPWGAWVGLGVSVSVIMLRAFSATPTGQPPSGEA